MRNRDVKRPNGTSAISDKVDRCGFGIHIDDVPHLAQLGNRELAELGFLDVTAAPFAADSTGKTDSTLAIADAVFFARNHKLTVFFPTGDYLVSDTIRCEGGWSDLRTTNHKYFPYCELWGCVLMGDQQGDGRARIILAESAMGFGNPEQPKPVLDYIARDWNRRTPTAHLEGGYGATSMNQSLIGIDIMIRPDNPGAAAVSFNAAEGCTIQDATFELGDAYTGILGGPGSGGAVYNLRIIGGQIGAVLNSPRPPCTLVACRIEHPCESAIDYSQRGTLTVVGCEFSLPRGVPALRVLPDPPSRLSSVSAIDCRIEYPAGTAPTTGIDTGGSVYLRDIWMENTNVICQSSEHAEIGRGEAGWTHVLEAAVPARFHEPIVANLYVDGVQREHPMITTEIGAAPPADLRSRHIWKEALFPCWNSPNAVNVKTAYGAVGDGETDDTTALQRAVDDHDIVFLPHGAYRVSRTLHLKPNTKLLGVHAPYSMIAPMMTEGGDFCDPKNPQPVLSTANTADADTQLAWFSVFMPRELAHGAYMLDWKCGGDSRLRCVFPITGYTINDLEPLSKGIYPWHNWSWRDFEFPNATGAVKHYTQDNALSDHADIDPPGLDKEAMPDWPLTRVRGFGAGGWYPFMALDGRSHGPNYRRILVENCRGPFKIYHAHLQYCRGKAEMEISNSQNVAVYGIKNEKDAIVVWVHDSQGVLVSGFGGVGKRNSDCKVLIENCSDVVFANLVDDSFDGDFKLKPDAHLPQVREVTPDGTVVVTPPFDKVALYKRT